MIVGASRESAKLVANMKSFLVVVSTPADAEEAPPGCLFTVAFPRHSVSLVWTPDTREGLERLQAFVTEEKGEFVHSQEFDAEDDSGAKVSFTMHHNGDYTGDVWINTHKEPEHDEFMGTTTWTVKIPFDVLKAFVAEYVRDKRIGELEQLDDPDDILGCRCD